MVLLIVYVIIAFICLLGFYRTPKVKQSPPVIASSAFIGVIPIHNESCHLKKIENTIRVFQQAAIPLILLDNRSTDALFDTLDQDSFIYKSSMAEGKYAALADLSKNLNQQKIILVDADINLRLPQLLQLINAATQKKWTWTTVIYESPSKFWHYFACSELELLQGSGLISANFNQPVISNSACSIVERETYLQFFETATTIRFGGDMLLTGLLSAETQCMTRTSPPVTTAYPSDFETLKMQRQRWLSNNQYAKSSFLLIFLYSAWLLLLCGSTLSSVLYFTSNNPLYPGINVIGFATILSLSLQGLNRKKIFSSFIYYTFGLYYHLFLFILIIFDRTAKK